MKEPLKLLPNGRIWMDTTHGAFLGYGRAELLENIMRLGSIRQAAIEMKMSYRQAWQLIDQMNEHAQSPIVVSQRGGKGGGRAEVTDLGKQTLTEFRMFNEAFQAFLSNYRSSILPSSE